MTDFTPLQALGPIAPADPSGRPLKGYLGHYGLAPLLAERSRERRIERLGWRVERVVARDLRNQRALARRIHVMVQEWPETA